MRLSQLLPSLLGVLSIASASTIPTSDLDDLDILEPRQKPTNPCASQGVHIIAAPGEGATDLSLLQTLVNNITYYIPGSDYVRLPYPIPQNSTDGLRITQKGAATLRSYIRKYHHACPNSKIVLAGYSGGAVINMNVLCGQSPPYNPKAPLPDRFLNNIIASVAYGDETFVLNQPYDLGTCQNGQGIHPRPNPAGCDYYSGIMQSYCDNGDPECCSPGTDSAAHFQYPQNYDYDATYFVYNKFFPSNKIRSLAEI